MKAFLSIVLGVWLSALSAPLPAQRPPLEVNGMIVNWVIKDKYIEFQLSAPTTGWLAIGFNETDALPGTYLVMARVQQDVVQVVEHKTLAPGDYQPITVLGGQAAIMVLSGKEQGNATTVQFRISQQVADGFHKQLLPGSKWRLLVAYSREDDFKHHSMMRTNIAITL
jgi:DOMON domain